MREAVRRCTELNLDEPLLGSAPHQPLWLMVDCPKPWAPKVQASHQFPEAARSLWEALAGPGQPTLLARTREVRSQQSASLIDLGRGLQWDVSLTDPEALAAMASGRVDRLPSRPIESAVYICSHGSRDSCCGTLGYPLWQAWPREHGAVYECSHLGGHRFAPTLLTLPDGRMWGRVATSDIEAIVSGAADALPRLRGRCSLTPPLQLIEAELQRRLGQVPHRLSGDESEWRAEFPGNGWRGRAVIGRESVERIQSCGDIAAGTGKRSTSLTLERLEVFQES